MLLLLGLMLLLLQELQAHSITVPSYDPPAGCSMVGCDFAQTGDARLSIPSTTPTVHWQVNVSSYSPLTGGCASNGRHIACNGYYDGYPLLLSYDGISGISRWNTSWPTSNTVPYLGGAGDAVAFDQDWLAYIYSYGTPSWRLPLLNAGQIFSPLYTTFVDGFGVIVLVFADGHLVSRGMDASPGGVIYLNDTFKGQSGIFQPIGVPPSTSTNRFYISTRFCPDVAGTGLDRYGRLYRIDIKLSIVQRVKVVWTYDYLLPQPLSPSTTCPSSAAFGASQTDINPSSGHITVVSNNSPWIFGSPSALSSTAPSVSMMQIIDVNDTPQLQHVIQLPSEPQSISLSPDINGNYIIAWLTWSSSATIWQVNTTYGAIIGKYDVSSIIQKPVATITNRITIGRLADGKGITLLFGIKLTNGECHVVALDASVPNRLSLLWSVPSAGIVTGQLSLIGSDDTSGPVVIAQTANSIIAYR